MELDILMEVMSVVKHIDDDGVAGVAADAGEPGGGGGGDGVAGGGGGAPLRVTVALELC